MKKLMMIAALALLAPMANAEDQAAAQGEHAKMMSGDDKAMMGAMESAPAGTEATDAAAKTEEAAGDAAASGTTEAK